MIVPLFDLDCTLLEGGNAAHEESFSEAFRVVYGVEASPHDVETQGKVDSQIILEALALRGIPSTDAAPLLPEAVRVMETYFRAHEDEASYTLLSGAAEAIAYFRTRGAPAGVLTGNVAGIGWRKCEKAGIRGVLDFGAFGDEALRRPDLVPLAQARACACARIGELCDFAIIGDTPLDIACAKQAGVRSIGVASGRHSLAELRASGADAVISTLEDIASAVRALALNREDESS